MKEEPETTTQPEAGTIGATNPSGMGTVIGIEKDHSTPYQPAERAFLEAHIDDMARLLAEGRQSAEDIDNIIHQEATDMAALGHINVTQLMKLKLAAKIGEGGKAREEGVRVATMSASGFMQKARSFWGKMVGGGGSADVPPEVSGGFNR